MKPSIGFLILSHRRPGHLLRLASTLSELYRPEAVICHHDFGQTPLKENLFPKSVTFLKPYTPTRWGHISIVWAVIMALRSLYEKANPEWFVLLSESDYPTRTAGQ